MKEAWSTIYLFYSDWLHPVFVSLVTILVNNQYGIYILLVLFIALLVVKRKIKVRTLPKVIDYIATIIVILLIIVTYDSFSPTFAKYWKQFTASPSSPSTSTQSSTSSKSSTKSTPSTQSTTTRQLTPAIQTTKRLYYAVSCSTCWNTNCVHTGYSYGGYDVGYYTYIRGLCQSCSCNDFKSQSFWK